MFCRRETTLPNAIQVVDGKIVKVDGASFDEYALSGLQTIDQLFDLIKEAEKDKLHMLEAKSYPDKGYLISVYIDRDLMMADEEMSSISVFKSWGVKLRKIHIKSIFFRIIEFKSNEILKDNRK